MVTLLSDLGLHDASVAIVKGILMQYIPALPIVDISHEVQPFNTAQTAYLLASSYKNFPSETCHILLFDVFSEATNRLILSEHNNQYFLSADNSLLPRALAAEQVSSWLCMELKPSETFNDWMHAAGRIVHLLQSQKPGEIGLQPHKLKVGFSDQLTDTAGVLNCQVVHIDNYQNVVLDITRQQFEAAGNGRSFRLQFLGLEEINELSRNYSDVRYGYKLCRFNSNGHLEICVNRGNAASLFGLKIGGKSNNIKIFFE